MMRAAIYARYSSDRQSDQSAEDQARLCADHLARQGWAESARFLDAAVSGATRDRPGLNALLLRATEFDVVVAESLDRISRNLEDIAAIYSRLRFAGVRLHTVSEGDISDLHVGLKGTMAAMFLKDLGDKTRRGQAGRVRAGAVPGGLSYGYRKRIEIDARGEPVRGLRSIDAAEAAIIRRIFTAYAAGQSPRAIAAALNAEGIAGPAGGAWRTSTIGGSTARGTGILTNPLYAGQIVFNRQRFIRDPDSRRRVSRANAVGDRITAAAPDLAIIDADLWQAVQLRRADTGKSHPSHQRRPKRLLSGIVKCGVCGGAYVVIGTDSWGCARRRDSNTCTNRATIMTAPLERRVIAAIRRDLLTPEAIAAFEARYQSTRRQIDARQGQQREQITADLATAEAKVQRLVEAIGEGAASFADVRALLERATATRDAAKAALANWKPADVIRLHPGGAARFRRQIETLSETLGTSSEASSDAASPATTEAREAARQALRNALVEIRATPAASGRGVDLQLAIALSQALNEKSPPARSQGAKSHVKDGCGDTLQSLAGVVCIAA